MNEMTPCDAIWDLLSLYADGEASPSECETVRVHVAECEACALDLVFLRETATALARTPDVAPPPDLKQAILAATIYRPTWQERLQQAFAAALPAPRMRFAGTAAVVTLVGFVLFRALQQPTPTQPSPEPAPAIAPHGPGIATAYPPVRPLRAKSEALASAETARQNPAAAARKTADESKSDARERLAQDSSEKRPAAHKLNSVALITHPVIRRQSFRVPDDKRLASAEPLAPKPVDESALTEPADMREVTNAPGPAGKVAMGEGGSTEKHDAVEGMKTPARGARYVLTADAPAAGADTLVTFANLRSELRKGNSMARTASLDAGMTDRHALLDVYRSRF